MATEPNSGLNDFRGFTDGESGYADEFQTNMLRIGRVGFHILAQDKDLQEPDSSVNYSDGDTFIVASGATGVWVGQDNNIAVWDGVTSEWVFYIPREGWRVAVQDEEVDYRFAVDSSSGWVKQPTALSDGSVTIDGDLSAGGAASVSSTLNVTGTIDSGNINIAASTPILTLKDSNDIGNAQSGFVRYFDRDDNETAYFGFGSSSNTKFYIGNTIGDILLYSPSPVTVCVDIDGNVDAQALRVDRAGSTSTDPIAEFVSDSGAANTTVCRIMVDGDLENINNSYGAISDEQLKENIRDATPKLLDLMRIRIRHFNWITKPDEKQIGVIAQELEQIFPGLVVEKPEYETVPDLDWEPSAILKPVTQKVKRTRSVPVLTDGRYVLQEQEYEEEEVVFDRFPVYDLDGNFTGKFHTVPRRAEELEPESNRPTVTRPTGRTIKSVKYSIFVPMLILAMQELYGMLDQGNANT